MKMTNYIQAPDPNGRYSIRYLTDLAYRQAWDDADRKARRLTDLWRAGEYAIAELPTDAYDLNECDYY